MANLTFVALKFAIDNWRWSGVPFYLRTGKRLPNRATEIAIHFRRTPFALFRHTRVKDLHANKLLIHIQPNEGISIQMGAKIPGALMDIGQVTWSSITPASSIPLRQPAMSACCMTAWSVIRRFFNGQIWLRPPGM